MGRSGRLVRFLEASLQPAARIFHAIASAAGFGSLRRIVHRLRGWNSPAFAKFFEEASEVWLSPEWEQRGLACVTNLPNRDSVSTDKP